MEFNVINGLLIGGTLFCLTLLTVVILFIARVYNNHHKRQARFKDLYQPLVSEIRASHLQSKHRNKLRLELTNRYLYAIVDLIKSTDSSSFIDEDAHDRWHFEAQKIGTRLDGELKSLYMDLYSENKTHLPLTEVITDYIKSFKERTWSSLEPKIVSSGKIVDSETLFALLKITDLACKGNATTFEISGETLVLAGLDLKAMSRVKGLAYAYDFELQNENGQLIIQFNQPVFF